MKIETKTSIPFKYEILDTLQNEQGARENMIEWIKQNVKGIFEESLSEVLRLREYLNVDEIEISVSIGIGDPDDEDE